MKKRLLSLLLALCMVLALTPVTALAGMLPSGGYDPATTLAELQESLKHVKGEPGEDTIRLAPAANFWDGSSDGETINLFAYTSSGTNAKVELQGDWTIPKGKIVETNLEFICGDHQVIVEGSLNGGIIDRAVFKDESSILYTPSVRKGDIWTIEGTVEYSGLHLEGELHGEQGKLLGEGAILSIYSSEDPEAVCTPVLSGELEILSSVWLGRPEVTTSPIVITIAENSNIKMPEAGHSVDLNAGDRIDIKAGSTLTARLVIVPGSRVDVAGELYVPKQESIYLGGEICLADSGVLTLDKGRIQEYRSGEQKLRGKITGSGTIKASSEYYSIDTSFGARVFDIDSNLDDPDAFDQIADDGWYDYHYHDVIGENVKVWCNWTDCKHTWESKVIEPTCDRWGHTAHACTICGTFDSTDLVEPLGHIWGEWTVTKEATETEEGSRTRACTREGCEGTETEAIPAIGSGTVTPGPNPGGPSDPVDPNPGGSSSSSDDDDDDDTTTSITTNSNGSTTTKVTDHSTGTVTETTRDKDGTKTVKETKKDGTVTTTKTQKDGTVSKIAEKDGQQEVSVTYKKADEPTVKLPVYIPVNATVTVSGQGEGKRVEIPVTGLTAGTVAVLVENGQEKVIPTTLTTNSGLSVTLPDGATVKVKDNTKTFNDVAGDYWGRDAVTFVTSRELFNGTGSGSFSPNATMTRQMLMTVLARLDGADTKGAAYEKGIAWAVSAGISDGKSPEADISREQLAVMLYRYAGKLGMETTASGDLSKFSDSSQTSAWAEEAMGWAVGAGLIGGKGGGAVDPTGTATRAEVATILQRMTGLMAK